MIITNERNETNAVCHLDFYAPPHRVLRQPRFCRELARLYQSLGLSGPAILYWIEQQLFDCHDGQLFDEKGKLMAIKEDPTLTDDVWRADERRTILRFIERADKPFTYLLHKRMIPVVTLLHFAREIYLSNNSQGCVIK